MVNLKILEPSQINKITQLEIWILVHGTTVPRSGSDWFSQLRNLECEQLELFKVLVYHVITVNLKIWGEISQLSSNLPRSVVN